MKKRLIIICFLFLSFLLLGCEKDDLNTLKKVENYFIFPIETKVDLDFPKQIVLDGKEVKLEWSTSNNALNSDGVVTRLDHDQEVSVSVLASIGNTSMEFNLFTTTVLRIDLKEYKITYDLDGGECDVLLDTILEGEEYYLPTPKKEGYVFIGWYQGDTKVEKVKNGNYNLQARYIKGEDELVISFDEDNIYVGTQASLEVQGYDDLSVFNIYSTDEDVAYIDDDFFLIGLKKGYTVISLTLKNDPTISGSILVNVYNMPPILYREQKPLMIGDSFQIRISHYEDNSSLFDIEYDSDYLSFDGSMFTALKDGEVTIKYSLKEDHSATNEIKVVIYPIKPVIEISSNELVIGSTTRVDILNYEDENKYKIEVTPDNAIINGKQIKPLSRGDYEIKVILVEDESLYSTLNIHVKPVEPRIVLTQNDIYVNTDAYLFFDNLEELDDTNIDNYDISISDSSVVSRDGFKFRALSVGSAKITITNRNDSELSSSIEIKVSEKSSVKDEDNEIGLGTLYIKHKDVESFDGLIHAGDMDYLEIDGAIDPTKYEWVSSNNLALVIFEDGRYIAIEEGEAVVLVVKKSNKEVMGLINVRVYGVADIDYASRLIKIAETQLGYVEGPNNLTKYGMWYGIPDGEWCAMFVSWCANQSGISTEIIPKYASCTAGREWFEKRGLFRYKEEYIPKAGDIIFFLSDGAGHTGIVINSTNSRVYTIEGNTSNTCAKRSYDLNYHTITGYGTPNYPPFSGSTTGGDTSGSTEGGGHSTH